MKEGKNRKKTVNYIHTKSCFKNIDYLTSQNREVYMIKKLPVNAYLPGLYKSLIISAIGKSMMFTVAKLNRPSAYGFSFSLPLM